MSFAALSTLSKMPIVTARLDAAIRNPRTAANPTILLCDLYAVADAYDNIENPSDYTQRMIDEVFYMAFVLRAVELQRVPLHRVPAFVLEKIKLLHTLCSRVETLLSDPSLEGV